MNIRHLLAVLLLVFLPGNAEAAVRISEIAWMGSSDNANAEWIELVNTGSAAVPLSGWKITSSTGSPSITLAGTIAAGGFYLLTRTSLTIIPGVTGDQVYTGALANGGATLTLVDGSGTTMDTVVGGTNWASIGGDNVTKQTPQLTSSGTWVTAAPTPRAATVAADGESDTGSTTPEESGTSASSTPPVSIGGTVPAPSALVPSVPRLLIYAGTDRTLSSRVDEPFTALVYDGDGEARLGVPVTWSFGDGTQSNGPSVHHTYPHAGRYLVVVRAEDGRTSTVKTMQVFVSDPQVSLAPRLGGIAVTNAGKDIVDLSAWKLDVHGTTFTMPRDTALLPGSTVVFDSAITGLEDGPATLRYPTGEDVLALTATTTELVAVSHLPVPHAIATAMLPKEASLLPKKSSAAPRSKSVPPAALTAAVESALPLDAPRTSWTSSFVGFLRTMMHFR